MSEKGRSNSWSIESCVYPEVADWMYWNGYSFNTLAKMTQLSFQTISRTLQGRTGTSKHTIDQILKVTGLTYEVAFRREV